MNDANFATEKTEKMKRKDGKEIEDFKPRNTLKTRKKKEKIIEDFNHRCTQISTDKEKIKLLNIIN